ncbi:hypothetical protein ACFP3I_21885 [Chryseobacterium arachidis]|uniref:hypothetical protein n=1 Tax=Chryseobacterium arachidis TaxID=1416778 RepID=UPI0036161BA8
MKLVLGLGIVVMSMVEVSETIGNCIPLLDAFTSKMVEGSGVDVPIPTLPVCALVTENQRNRTIAFFIC